MSIKNGILYQIGYPDNEWVEELSGKWSNNYQPKDKYEGEIENGEPNGNGSLTSNDGGSYIGEFKNGLYHGQGTFTYGRMAIRHGYVLEGQWKNGTCHGQIITTYPDGRKFKGTWIDNVAQDDWDQIFD